MKKFSTVLLILFLSTLFITSFTACDKLKITNLKANKHFKTGNKFYTEEKYKRAITEYEAALQLNPELKSAFYYLGSSYIMVYKPGDDSEKNKEYGTKAVEYLQKALELNPDNKDILQALGDINDKLGNFEEAEKYYLQVQKFTSNDPASYYNLAGFYTKSHLPGVGVSIGATRLFDQLRQLGVFTTAPSSVTALVALLDDTRLADGISLANQLRAGGVCTELAVDARKLAKQIQYADRAGIRFVVICGEAEAAGKAGGEQHARLGQRQIDGIRVRLRGNDRRNAIEHRGSCRLGFRRTRRERGRRWRR